jgi:hypothetical protein
MLQSAVIYRQRFGEKFCRSNLDRNAKLVKRLAKPFLQHLNYVHRIGQ